MTDGELTPDFEALLHYLKESRGFDFTGYKRVSLQRRIDKRMGPSPSRGPAARRP